MIVLGIDPGSRVTGYGLVQKIGSRFQSLEFGTIKPHQNLEEAEKYLYIFEGIYSLIETFSPDAVSVEAQFFHKNAQSALKLGMARAAACIAAAKLKVPVFSYAPTKVKLAVVGKGAAGKEQVQKMIQLLLALPALPTPHDAADGLALALCHHQNSQFLNRIR